MLILLSALSVEAADDATFGAIDIDAPTHHAAGVVVSLEGDDDLDATATPYFRRVGDKTWREGLGLLRVEQKEIEKVWPGNILAGSLFDLESDVAYEVKVECLDPDGGSATLTTELRTRAVPPPTALDDVRYVTTGDGGGSGTKGDPYQGLEAAEAEALPGSVFLLEPGTYPPHTFAADGEEGAPVTWRGSDGVVFDDDGSGWTLNLGDRAHVVLESFAVTDTDGAIYADGAHDLVLRNLEIEVSRDDGDPVGIDLFDSTDCTISDNVLVGPEADWVARVDDSFGIKVSGSGHVVQYNDISHFWDNIGMASEGSISIDIVGNDVHESTDDGIETDDGQRNIRVVGNRIRNSLKGMSAQPVYGGPVYFIRNQAYNTISSAYKFHVGPSGLFVLHNSTATADAAFSDGEWSNAIFRNNIFYGTTGYVMETVGTLEDMDYNAWSPKQDPVLKFNDVRYDTINASCDDPSATTDWCSATGNGRHDVEYERDTMWASLPEPPGEGSTPGEDDFTFELHPDSVAIDSAELLPNVGDCFEGSGPDRGALELGGTTPVWGPRDDWEDAAWAAPCEEPAGSDDGSDDGAADGSDDGSDTSGSDGGDDGSGSGGCGSDDDGASDDDAGEGDSGDGSTGSGDGDSASGGDGTTDGDEASGDSGCNTLGLQGPPPAPLVALFTWLLARRKARREEAQARG